MSRHPSIHITLARLKLILKDYGLSRQDCDDLALYIIESSSKYSLTNRSLLATNQKVAKKTDKLVLSSNEDAYLIVNRLTLTRQKAKHKGIPKINPGSKEFLICKEIANNANRFALDFGIEKSTAYTSYCTMAIAMMKNFFLARIPSLHESICSKYEAFNEVFNDKNKNITEALHTRFQSMIIDKVGFSNSYTNDLANYKYFVVAAAACVRLGIKPEDYIKAQFQAFEWRDGIPAPPQLTGDKAIERVVKYAYLNSIKLKGSTKNLNLAKIIANDNDND